MSTRISNILIVPGSPYDGLSGMFTYLIDDQSAFEAPPFYETITVRFWGSGTRYKLEGTTSTTEVIDYDESKTFSRQPLAKYDETLPAFPSVAPRAAVSKFTLNLPSLYHDHPGEMVCVMQSGLANGFNRTPYFGRHYLKFVFYEEGPTVSIGVGTIVSTLGTTVSNIETAFLYLPPEWGFTFVGVRTPYDKWVMAGGLGGSDLDISGITNWRDIRGTYESSDPEPLGSWDTNTVVNNTSITIA